MKIKYSWIPFIPVAFISVFLRVYQVMFVQNGMDTGFLSSAAIWTIYTALVVLLLIFLIVFTAADKQTSPKYTIGKNFFAGLFGVILGLLLVYGGCVSFAGITGGDGKATVMTILDALFSIVGGAGFCVVGWSMLAGKNTLQSKKLVAVLPVLWCCVRMIAVFMAYTTQAVHSVDMTDLIYLAFATLFMYNFAVIVADIDGRNPVKACFLYGMPAVVIALVYSAVRIVTQINTHTFNLGSDIDVLQAVALSMFILFFLTELTSKAKSKKDTAVVTETKAQAETLPSTEITEPTEETVTEEEPQIISNVDESVQEEMVGVNSVLKDLEADDNNAQNADPLSEQYLTEAQAQETKSTEATPEGTDDYNTSLDKINALISTLAAEDKEEK